MINTVYDLKNKLLESVNKEASERGIERLDGNKVDMIKDLAETEYYCMKAKYYDTVIQEMKGGSSGYGSGGGAGTGSSAGYASRGGSMSQGYASRDGMQYSYDSGRTMRSGSMGHQELMEPLRMAIQNASPDEREHLRNEAMGILGMR